MKCPLRALCAAAIVCLLATVALADEAVDVGARVVKIDAKQTRATISRGKKAGLALGAIGELFPVRTLDGAPRPTARLEIRLARGTVVELTDTTAVVALDGIADTVEVGAYFVYKIKVPDELARSSMFRVTAAGIELTTQDGTKAFITLEGMLADPSVTARDQALDAMIAEMKAMKPVIERVGRIDGGRHHGKPALQVVDELTRAELIDLFEYLDSAASLFVPSTLKSAELYFTWVINKTTSGARDRALREVKPLVVEAEAALRQSRLDVVRTKIQLVLKSVPDHEGALTTLAGIDKCELWIRQLLADPDDTTLRYSLVVELFKLHADELARQHNEILRRVGYDRFETDRIRGYLLTRAGKHAQAETLLKQLVKERPDDEVMLQAWLAKVRAKARVAASPNDPTARLMLAVSYEAGDETALALAEYRRALEAPGATAKQREVVRVAQERLSIRELVKQHVDLSRYLIELHNLADARTQMEQALQLVAKSGDATRANEILNDLGGTAHRVEEDDLWIELMKRQTGTGSDNKHVLALAFALLNTARFDEAATAAKQAAGPKDDRSTADYILAFIAKDRDDLAEAERRANKTRRFEPHTSWPLEMLARVEAGRGNWQEAVDHARAALKADYGVLTRLILNAALRGLQAHEALVANPSSARERLRLIRALATLGLIKRANLEIAKLPADGEWRAEAAWSVVETLDWYATVNDRLAAARSAKPTTALRKRRLALLEAQAKFRNNPKDEAARADLARHYLLANRPDPALATLGPLRAPPVRPAISDLVRDAYEQIEVRKQLDLAREASNRGDHATAERLALAYQRVHDRIGGPLGRTAARSLRVDNLAAQGRYGEAIALSDETRAIVAADGDPMEVAYFDRGAAELQAAIGTNDLYRKALSDGLKLCDDRDDDYCLLSIHESLEVTSVDQGQMADALDHARKAWTIADRLSDAELSRTSRARLARLNLQAGRIADGEQLALALLPETRKASDATNEESVLNSLGSVALLRGETKNARDRFQEIYDLGTRTGNIQWRAASRRLQGAAWVDDHEYVKAAAAFEHAASLLERIQTRSSITLRATIMNQLAEVRLKERKLPEARKAAEQSLATAQRYQRRTTLAWAEVQLATIAIAEANAADAMAHAGVALELAKQTDGAGLLAASWGAIARAYALKNQDAEASDAFDKALEHRSRALLALGGESERDNYLNTEDARELYTDAVTHFLKVDKTARAMEVLEESRNAKLKQAYDPATIQTADPKLRAQLERYETERAQIVGLQTQLDAAANKPGAQRSEAKVKTLADQLAKSQQKLKGVARELKGTHNDLYRVMGVDPQSLIDRRQQLPKGAVLVEYYAADDALYAFVLSAAIKQPAIVRVKIKSTDLTQAVTEFRTALIQEAEKIKARDKVEALGRKLEDWLLQPLRKHLEGATTVIIVPFGALYYVPFDALVTSDAGKPLRYALEDYRFSIQTAMTIERLLEPARARTTGTLLALSNPDGTLTGAQREVARIKKSIPDARVLTRKEASLKKFIDIVGGFRYVHIASHGILHPDPWKSYLKLADANLTVSDITKLKGLRTSTEMVVLSACESATAHSATSTDDLMSLAGGFAWAGAPAIVASLWEVSDESTAELMATFYRALEANTGDRLDALRNAKLNLLRFKRGKATPYAAPWHWASFELFGDFRAPSP